VGTPGSSAENGRSAPGGGAATAAGEAAGRDVLSQVASFADRPAWGMEAQSGARAARTAAPSALTLAPAPTGGEPVSDVCDCAGCSVLQLAAWPPDVCFCAGTPGAVAENGGSIRPPEGCADSRAKFAHAAPSGSAAASPATAPPAASTRAGRAPGSAHNTAPAILVGE